MNLYDRLSGFFWFGISIFICVKSMQVGMGTFRSPGSGFLPFWAGVALGLLSIMLAAKSFASRKREKKIKSLWEGMNWGKVLLLLISLYIYAILLQEIGYLVMTFGLMVLLFGVVGKTRLWIQILAAFITVLATYFIFHVWLGVQLPGGIIHP